jgi:hypothetical protein
MKKSELRTMIKEELLSEGKAADGFDNVMNILEQEYNKLDDKEYQKMWDKLADFFRKHKIWKFDSVR